MSINETQATKSPRRGAVPAAATSGAQYEVLRTSHINGRVVNRGEVVEYDGVPGRYLRPLNAAAQKAKDEADAIRKEQRAAVIQPLAVDPTREAALKLRDLDNQRRGIDPEAAFKTPEPKPALPAKEQQALKDQAEASHVDTLAQSVEAGGVTLQMTGKSPETVTPTTGPGAVATSEQAKAAAAKKAEAKK